MKSIRGALTLWLLTGLGVVLLAGGLGLFVATRRALTRHFDETLVARASALIAATRWDGSKVDVDFADQVMPWYGPEARSECFELRGVGDDGEPAGEPILRSPSLASRPWALPALPAEGRMITDAPLPDGRRGRIVAINFRPVPDEDVEANRSEQERRANAATAPRLVLVAGKSRMELDRAIATLLSILAAAGVMIAGGVVVAVRLAVHRGLAPLGRLSTDVRGIGAESLSRRLNERSLPVELRAICGRLNDLLRRLESAFARERRFTAAAAHELRTPVAELRSMLEVGLSRPRTAEESRRSLADALAVALQMERLVESLFRMTGHETGRAPEIGPVEVSPLLARLRQRHEPAARARDGEIVIQGPEGVRVLANHAMLEAVLDNVMANAVEYGAPRPTIRCEVVAQEEGAPVRIEITNPAADLTDGDAQRLFEPFWRRSDARSEREHLGLGLTLSRQFAEAMGGALTAGFDVPGSLRVRLSLGRPSDSPSHRNAGFAVVSNGQGRT